MILAELGAGMEGKNEIRVGTRELRGNLTHYLKLAREGTTVLVTSRNTVLAQITPPRPEALPPRKPGALKGQIWMADDFDTWPDDILSSFESGKF